MDHIDAAITRLRSGKMIRQDYISFVLGSLGSFIVVIIIISSLQEPAVPAASAGAIPFFQFGSDQDSSFIANSNSSNNNTTLRTYENPGFGLSIQYPSSWTGTQLRADPSTPTNTSIVAIFEAPLENQSDSYRENLVIGVQGPNQDVISLEEYTQNSLNAFRSMSNRIMILELSPSSLSGLPAQEIVYTSNLQNLNLKKMQIFTIVNGNTAYVVTFGAEESHFNEYIPEIKKMINSIRINSQAMR